jgi:outer membrane scaffolding protein for murein synthesis (MipA/OmpV family)
MIAPDFIPGGAHQNDFGANISYAIGAHLTAAGTLQYEKYNIPLIVDRPQSDVTASVTLTYWPRKSQESK